MVSFKEHLVEAFGDSAKYYKAIQTLERALDQATRPYQRLHDAEWVRHMGPKFGGPASTPERQFMRKATSLWLKGELATHAVVWFLHFDQSTRPKTGPLGTDKLKMDTAVIAEPVTGEIIVVPSISAPQPAFRYVKHKSSGKAIAFSGIQTAVKQAIGPLKFFADNHHKAHYYEQYLGEDAGDRAAQTDREWLAKKIDLIELVKKQLNDSVRTAHNLNYITSAKWRLWRGQAGGWSSSNLRRVLSALKPDLQKTAVVFALEVKDTRPKDGPLGTHRLPFHAVVVVDPVEGNMIAVPDIRQPQKSTFSKGHGAHRLKAGRGEIRLANMFRIDKVVKAATQNLVFYARQHHSTRRG